MSFWSNTVDWITGGDTTFRQVVDSVDPFWGGVANLAGSYFLSKSDFANTSAPNVGYQGGIPRYTAVRQSVADTYDPTRRPGSGGRRYFTDTQFVDPYAPIETAVANDAAGDIVDAAAEAAAEATTAAPANETPQQQRERLRQERLLERAEKAAEAAGGSFLGAAADAAADAAAADTTALSQDPTEGGLATLDVVRQLATRQGEMLRQQNIDNPANQLRPAPLQFAPPPTGNMSPIMSRAPAQVIQDMPVPAQTAGLEGFVPRYAAGGIANLAGGRYLTGATDGMADRVPANIDGRQEARLSDGEFVIPADVVSHLGNGNSNAGAQQLYAMMDSVRKARTGNADQGRQINPAQYLPRTR
jgi:hypothetical protein